MGNTVMISRMTDIEPQHGGLRITMNIPAINLLKVKTVINRILLFYDFHLRKPLSPCIITSIVRKPFTLSQVQEN